jgi:DNA-binding transcriptional MerR regulator
MTAPEALLSIGQFARASGLTAKALRHYDAVGLLAPASVDADSGYRRYRHDQVAQARLIRMLRDLEFPVPEVRRLLELHDQDPDALGVELGAHRKRLESRVVRLQRQLHTLDHLVAEKGWQHMGDKHEPGQKIKLELDPDTERKLGITLFNGVWELLEKEDRTEADDAQMLHQAHASCYHWMQVGTLQNRARGEWMCSHVYAVLGRAEPALFHAQIVLDICRREGIGDFDLGYAYEAMARASAVAGDTDEAHRWAELARSASTEIANDVDKEIFMGDLETLPAGI